jgi:macrodomain Ter protein organizer (MatP/YcbG family)
MRRTQLYMEDDVWKVLQIKAKQSKTTISELVRQAVREKYLEKKAERKEAMLSMVGLWKDRTDLPDTETYVRSLRTDDRLKRIFK